MTGHLLLIEEEAMIAQILAHKLRREGHDVEWLRDLPESWPPCDAAIVDIGHGAGADPTAAAVGRAAPAGGRWLAMVEAGDTTASQAAMAHGAAGLVVKPFKPTEVAARVSVLLQLRS